MQLLYNTRGPLHGTVANNRKFVVNYMRNQDVLRSKKDQEEYRRYTQVLRRQSDSEEVECMI